MISLRDLAPPPDEPEPIKGNLKGESITGAKSRSHLDNNRNEEDQITKKLEMPCTTYPETLAVRQSLQTICRPL